MLENLSVIDQMGREVSFSFPPRRIISLVPSQTELLFDLGLEGYIVGVTKFCVHPREKVKSLTKVGGTKNFNFERIRALKPDIIIGNKEENYKEGIELLSAEFPVWMSDIFNIDDALEMMSKIGEITNKTAEADYIRNKINSKFRRIHSGTLHSAAYLIWKEPVMAAAGSTFINEMLKMAGFVNVFEHLDRYPIISDEDLKKASPDFILLSSEPYPFKEKHVREFKGICSKSEIKLVDGEIFSWYGSRLLKAEEYFNIIRAEIEAN